MELTLNHAVEGLGPSGIRSFTALAKATPGAVMLTIGEPDLNSPEMVKAAAKQALDRNDTHYPDNNGRASLRKAIAEFEAEKHGLHYSPEEIIVTIGATEALFASLMTILNPGDEVIIPTPAFGLYESIVRLCRGVPVALPTQDDAFQISRRKLEAAVTPATRALILTSPNNPTGCVYSRETLEGIHEVLREKPVFVLCDEVYRQLVYTDDDIAFSSYTDMRDRIIVVQSFSKPYAMTGWRMGYLMADAPVREKIRYVHQFSVVSAPSFEMPACEAALRYDVSEDVALFRRRRDYVFGRLTGMGLEVHRPDGAFYMFVDIRKYGMDSTAFCTRLLREGLVALVPGICFGTEGFARLSYCCGEETLKLAMDRMEAFLPTL
jgi:aminotransferase